MDMKCKDEFTQKELEMISDALLCHLTEIENVKRYIGDAITIQFIDDYMDGIRKLHNQVCSHMEDK